MAHLLGSIQASACRVQYGWRLLPTRGRALALCIGHPAPDLRRTHDQPSLAAHLALALSANWLTIHADWLTLTPEALAWLRESPADQLASLKKALHDPVTWPAAVRQLHLEAALGLDMTAYLSQHLARDRSTARPRHTRHAMHISQSAADRWQIDARATLTTEAVFHLHQFADCLGGDRWAVTPASLQRALQAGYGLAEVTYWLTDRRADALTDEQQATLREWAGRRQRVRLAEVQLLSTSQPEYLDAIMARRSLRRHVQRRLGPRHAVVSTSMDAPLQRYLQSLGLTRDPVTMPVGPSDEVGDRPGHDVLISLHVLTGLRHYLPLRLPGLGRTLADWEARYSTVEQDTAAEEAQAILTALQRVVEGRDAFWPAQQWVEAGLYDRIEAAIAAESALTIDYQGPGDVAPRRRTVEPHWLERIGQLAYLHAYCRLTESERVFRLDRLRLVEG